MHAGIVNRPETAIFHKWIISGGTFDQVGKAGRTGSSNQIQTSVENACRI